MPAPRPLASFPFDAVRAAIARAVDATSIRSVAREIEISHGGVVLILEGGNRLQKKTQRKLLRWYVRQAAVGAVEPDETAARAAVAVLASGFPKAERDRATVELFGLLREFYRARGVPFPEWIEQREARAV